MVDESFKINGLFREQKYNRDKILVNVLEKIKENNMYLVCMMDSNLIITSSEFKHVKFIEEAKDYAEKRVKEYLDGFPIESLEWENNRRCIVNYIRDDNFIRPFKEFILIEILDVSRKYSIVGFHGFDGVDFELIDEFDTRQEADSAFYRIISDELTEDIDEYEITSDYFVMDTGEEWVSYKIIENKED